MENLMAADLALNLPPDTTAPGLARAAAKRLLDGKLSPERLSELALVISELVSNALVHGRGQVVFRLQLDEEIVRGEVVDEGGGFEREMRERGPDEVSGHGLFLVEALTDRWGIHEGTTHVWFEFAAGTHASRQARPRDRGGDLEVRPLMPPDEAVPADADPPERGNGNRVRAGKGVIAEVGSLARLVHAGDRQRETLERDLHDGLQQRLVAVRIRLAIAVELTAGDARLRGELSAIGEDLDEAIDELREVASGIYPTILADRGLVAALEHIARAAARPVAVTSTGLTRQPAELELAIYYCCREAIQNACKHGGASVNIAIVLHEDAHGVGFEVSDDGPGFDVANARSGRGLQHMRDRIALLGGRLSIDSHPGTGTVVSGAIPPR
jgi:signal transduction histidine kinase